MMDAPFYRSYWNVPSRPRHAPSVREIPVHYVGSEQRVDKSGSAVKIQKVFRGFLVRKSLKKITEIRSQVEETEKRISEKETVDLIKRDSKERLRVNEMLMSLLFKLDSVRGVDSGVRDCRKAVIKKTISLQERVDAVVSGNTDEAVENVKIEAVDQTVMECTEDGENDDTVDNVEKIVEAVDQTVMECTEDGEIDETVDNVEGIVEAVDQTVMECTEDGENDEAVDYVEKIVEAGDQTVMECAKDGENCDGSVQDNAEAVNGGEIVNNQNDKVGREVAENCDVMPSASDCPEESVGANQTESQSDSSANPQSLIEACEEDDNSSSKQENDAVETYQAEDTEVIGKEYRDHGTGEENTRNRELLERMMEDNEKMMDLMAQLFERNEMQTRLLNSLSQRVEQLEKAFVCERLRKKKKRHAGTVDSCETAPENKKCGKR